MTEKRNLGIRKTNKIKATTPHYLKPNAGLERRREEMKKNWRS
jgi:hypothetical protein